MLWTYNVSKSIRPVDLIVIICDSLLSLLLSVMINYHYYFHLIFHPWLKNCKKTLPFHCLTGTIITAPSIMVPRLNLKVFYIYPTNKLLEASILWIQISSCPYFHFYQEYLLTHWFIHIWREGMNQQDLHLILLPLFYCKGCLLSPVRPVMN